MLVKRCSKIMQPDGKVEAMSDAWRKAIGGQIQKMAESASRTMMIPRRIVVTIAEKVEAMIIVVRTAGIIAETIVEMKEEMIADLTAEMKGETTKEMAGETTEEKSTEMIKEMTEEMTKETTGEMTEEKSAEMIEGTTEEDYVEEIAVQAATYESAMPTTMTPGAMASGEPVLASTNMGSCMHLTRADDTVTGIVRQMQLQASIMVDSSRTT